MAGWCWCLLMVLGVTGEVFGSSTVDSTCASTSYFKTEAVQYVEYVAEMPDLSGFTLHYWIHLLEPSSFVCPFAYINEADDTSIQVLVVRSELSWTWVIQVNGVVVSLVTSPVSLVGKWHHVLHSWHSHSGNWSFYLDGHLVDSGINLETKGMTVSGGGRAYSGQRYNAITSSEPCDEGVHGWLTLLGLDTRGIQRAEHWMSRLMVTVLVDGCSPEQGGDILTWDYTPRQGYGGVMTTRANTTCGHF
ncbi:C-reactive protein 1.4-like [Homarus americanus]|uniref:C-reactive protein 1.4-like n=1 Tax=Homarus americanus TaxID=6706 RepID=A0A8J5NAL9_HOMAM|nr:C-reactive protein 1.4-like [Homarus americanus]